MSVTSTQSLAQFAVASLGQAFNVPFGIQNASDLVVTDTNATSLVDTVLTLNTDYFVTGTSVNGVIANPIVTLEGTGIRYAIGDTLTIQRKNPFTQPTTYVDGTSYLAATTNNALDWLCYEIQALYDIAKRCAQVPATSGVQSAIPLATRKLMLLGFDANGNFITYGPPAGSNVNPFPAALAPSFPIFLPGITAHTGGGTTALDGQNITTVTQVIVVELSLNDNTERWKLRPYVAGDLNVSDGVTTIVPVVNPSNLRWIRVG